MTAELPKRNTAAVADSGAQLNSKLARQVSAIIEEAEEAGRPGSERQPVKPTISYRIPSPGVRYYF